MSERKAQEMADAFKPLAEMGITTKRAEIIKRYSVGDCEMLPSPQCGSWVNAKELRTLIDLITDDDAAPVMLAKLKQLKEQLA